MELTKLKEEKRGLEEETQVRYYSNITMTDDTEKKKELERWMKKLSDDQTIVLLTNLSEAGNKSLFRNIQSFSQSITLDDAIGTLESQVARK